MHTIKYVQISYYVYPRMSLSNYIHYFNVRDASILTMDFIHLRSFAPGLFTISYYYITIPSETIWLEIGIFE